MANNGIEGKIYCILGVPKIGKTSWVSQLCLEIKKQGVEIIWFDAPHDQIEQERFLKDFERIVIGKVVGFEISNQYADRKIGITELSTCFLHAKIDKKYLIIIDNTEQLSKDVINNIKCLFSLIKGAPTRENLGMILISSKNLKSLLGNISSEVYCPVWNEQEIEELLILSKIEIKNDFNAYCKLLMATSGGHPLVAISLAKRASSITDLLPIKPISAPALYDEDLTEEVKQFLFNDLVKDSDHRDLILRLSTLISRFNLVLMDFIASKINPTLRTPVKLMFENLKGILIEGDDQLGYQIAFIFKQIAMNYLSPEQKIDIYDKVSKYLITPKNKIINATDAIDAISYAIFAGNLRNAFSWTCMLLSYSRKKSFTKEQEKYLLSNLSISIIETLNFPKENDLKITYSIILLGLAMKYTGIEDFEKANKLLNKLLMNPLEQKEIPKELHLSAEQFNVTVRIYLVFNLALIKDYDGALKIINQFNAKAFLEFNPDPYKAINFLHVLIQNGKLSSFPINFIKEMVNTVQLNDDVLLGELASCFCSLGVIAYKQNDYQSLSKILEEETENNSLWKLFAKMAYAQYELEFHKAKQCLEIIKEIINSIEYLNVPVNSNKLKLKVLQMKGDAFYKLEDYENALNEYRMCLTLLRSDNKSFDYGWANYRAGLSTRDDDIAINYFDNASGCFEKLGYLNLKARSEGEKAVVLYKIGQIKEALETIVAFAEGYYLKGINDYGPAVVVGLSAATRLIAELEGKPFVERSEDGKVWPKLEKRVFSGILDIAKPEAGICAAFYSFSNVYKLLGEKGLQIKALQIAFESLPNIEIDKFAKAQSGLELVVFFVEKNNEKETLEIVAKLIAESRGYKLPNKMPLLYYIFPLIEELLKQGKTSKQSYINILETIEKNVDPIPETEKYWWLAAIYKRKAGIDGITEETHYNPDLLLKAWAYAMKSNNYDVIRDAGHQLGFKYSTRARNFKEIAEIQLSVVLAICNDTDDISRLETVGTNLSNYWSVVDFRRLTQSDLPYWWNLRHRAKNIVNESPKELHAPLMVLFLLLVNSVEQKEEYEKALLWATDKIKNRQKDVPKDEYRYIEHLFS